MASINGANSIFIPGIAPVNQSVWHFDTIAGSDKNDGLTATTALKSWAEYTRRTGTRPPITQRIDYYIHGDMDSSDALILAGQLSVSGAMYVHFVPNPNQIVLTGTLTGVVHSSQVTQQWEEIQDLTGNAGGPVDFSSYVGYLVKITPPGVNPIYCHILKAISPGHARVGWTVTANTAPGDVGDYIQAVTMAGYNYQVIQRPKCFGLLIDAVSQTQIPANLPISYVAILFEFGDFSGMPFIASSSSNGAMTVQLNTVFASCNVTNLAITAATSCNGCIWTPGFNLLMASRLVVSFGDAVNTSFNIECPMIEFFGLVMQNSYILCNYTSTGPGVNLHSHHAAYGIWMFDCPSPFRLWEGTKFTVEAGLFGQGNTGPILTLKMGAQVYAIQSGHGQVFFAQTSTVPEIQLDNQTSGPAVAETNPYAYTEDRLYSFANFVLPVASGGFGNHIFNPRFPATCIGNFY